MLHLVYVGESDQKYVVDFNQVNDHVIQITGDFPVKGNGFTLSRFDYDDGWDYTLYRTIYRIIDGGAQFSDDGTVYAAPPEPEPEPEPEPYVPSLEEVKAIKKQEIGWMHQTVVAEGIDVELSTGIKHFQLGQEEITFLVGKKIELESGVEEVSYQDANNYCILLSREDMQTIIIAAFSFVNVKTSYRNNLYEWIDKCTSAEEVEAITYGMDIPAEYQSDVYKKHLMEGADNEEVH